MIGNKNQIKEIEKLLCQICTKYYDLNFSDGSYGDGDVTSETVHIGYIKYISEENKKHNLYLNVISEKFFDSNPDVSIKLEYGEYIEIFDDIEDAIANKFEYLKNATLNGQHEGLKVISKLKSRIECLNDELANQ